MLMYAENSFPEVHLRYLRLRSFHIVPVACKLCEDRKDDNQYKCRTLFDSIGIGLMTIHGHILTLSKTCVVYDW